MRESDLCEFSSKRDYTEIFKQMPNLYKTDLVAWKRAIDQIILHNYMSICNLSILLYGLHYTRGLEKTESPHRDAILGLFNNSLCCTHLFEKNLLTSGFVEKVLTPFKVTLREKHRKEFLKINQPIPILISLFESLIAPYLRQIHSFANFLEDHHTDVLDPEPLITMKKCATISTRIKGMLPERLIR